MLKLYNYFRSSTSYRVRIALHLKKLPFEYIPVHLLNEGGEHHAPQFHSINPQELIPTLQDGDIVISQSLAIIEYLEERYPMPALLPADPILRAYTRQLALMMACDMHPLCNLRVMQYLSKTLSQPEKVRAHWIDYWTKQGLSALEELLNHAPWHGIFCVGDKPTLADCCLIPQLVNARRFNIDLTSYPTLLAVEAACFELPEFQLGHPNNQPDTE